VSLEIDIGEKKGEKKKEGVSRSKKKLRGEEKNSSKVNRQREEQS